MEIELKKMDLNHIDDIMVIENLCFSIPWSRTAFVEEIQNNKFAIYYVVEIDGHAYGYAGMWNVSGEGHITNIAVHPEFQKNKIGSILLRKMIELCSEYNIEALTLEVRKSNQKAINLYEKFGFSIEGIRKKYYADNGEDALIMWKKLILSKGDNSLDIN